MKKYALLIVIIILAVGGLAFALSDTSTDQDAINTQSNEQTTQSTIDQKDSSQENDQLSLTFDEVARHSDKDDCWTVIDGRVYDITEYIPRHPGGNDILLACGTDASSLFNDRQTTDGESIGSGSSHSSNAQRQLESFFVGNLAE